MIIYDLACAEGHPFEAWFRNPADFEAQQARGLLTCPQCNSHMIKRMPSAVAVSTGRSEPPAERAKNPPASPSKTANTAMPSGTELIAAYRQFVQVLQKNTEDVGTAFAEEARKIHYEEAPERPIRGQATPEECAELRDEGIDVLQLPNFSEEKLN